MHAALWYVATRLVGLAPLVWPEALLLREPTRWLIDLDRLGVAGALPEYPWPAAWLTSLPMQLGIPTVVHYYAVVILFLLAVDAALAWSLWRAAGRRISAGLWLWLLAFAALGPMTVTRFDLVPAALVTGALLFYARARPGAAGALVALGTGFKLWPVLALPGLLVPGERRERVRVIAGFAVVALALAIATVVAADVARLWSPLSLQGQRGLQIEAFAALPFLWLRFLAPDGAWDVRSSELCHCHEVFGPGVAQTLALADFAGFAAVAGVLSLIVRAFVAPAAARTPTLAALLAALTLIATLVTARVFSPQYMIWLAALLAVLGVLSAQGLTRTDLALFTAACLLTQLIYPLGYEALVVARHFLQLPLLVIVTLRDALLLALAARLARQTLRLTTR